MISIHYFRFFLRISWIFPVSVLDLQKIFDELVSWFQAYYKIHQKLRQIHIQWLHILKISELHDYRRIVERKSFINFDFYAPQLGLDPSQILEWKIGLTWIVEENVELYDLACLY